MKLVAKAAIAGVFPYAYDQTSLRAGKKSNFGARVVADAPPSVHWQRDQVSPRWKSVCVDCIDKGKVVVRSAHHPPCFPLTATILRISNWTNQLWGTWVAPSLGIEPTLGMPSRLGEVIWFVWAAVIPVGHLAK